MSSMDGGACPLAGGCFRYVKTNGITMRFAELGSPSHPTVLLLHGWPESWYSWRHQMTRLVGRGFHCVAPDLRGYGSSEAPQEVESYCMHSILEDIVGLLDALGKQRVALVCHDWGAIVGWAFAVLRPDRFPIFAPLSVPPTRSLGCWATDKHLVKSSVNSKDQTFFYTVYHNECKPHNEYGEAWPFVKSVTNGVAEQEYDSDPSTFLRMMYFTQSVPSCKALQPWSTPTITNLQRSAGGWIGRMPIATGFPAWCTEEEFKYYVSEFTRSGFRGGVNYYRNMDANILGTRHLPADTKVKQPCLFIAGQYDVSVLWAAQGITTLVDDVTRRCADLVGTYFVKNCGHWLMQEGAADVSDMLETFLAHAVVAGAEFAPLEQQAGVAGAARGSLEKLMGDGPVVGSSAADPAGVASASKL